MAQESIQTNTVDTGREMTAEEMAVSAGLTIFGVLALALLIRFWYVSYKLDH